MGEREVAMEGAMVVFIQGWWEVVFACKKELSSGACLVGDLGKLLAYTKSSATGIDIQHTNYKSDENESWDIIY